jgi:hypothetical protein
MLNWKNVQYANGSGLVNAIRDNNNQITKGNQQIIDSITGYADNRSTQETDQLVAAMTLVQDDGTDAGIKRAKADRNAILQSINPDTSFADLSTVIEAYKTANTPAEQTWQQQNAHEIYIQKLKNKDSFKEGKHNYSPSGIANEVTKLYPDAQNTSLWGLGNLWGESTPAADTQNRISKFISDMGMNDKEAKRAVKTLLSNTTYDTTGRNEVFINNGQMDTTIDDATNEQLTNILIRGGYLSDADKDKKKTDTK